MNIVLKAACVVGRGEKQTQTASLGVYAQVGQESSCCQTFLSQVNTISSDHFLAQVNGTKN
jgi:hypothetical protein